MTDQELRELGPALDSFLNRFLFCCEFSQSFDHLQTYVRGLLSPIERKSVEPIALAAGTPVRTLQEFLKDHCWDEQAVRQHFRRHVAEELAILPDCDGTGTVALIDETSVLKSGNKTPGVQRQYLGCVGKVDNGIVTVHTGVCRGSYKALLDADLFLPESWSEDRPRCREAGIPDEVVHRPKWQIALEQLDRAKVDGVKFDWVTFDEGYGTVPAFLEGLRSRNLHFVGEVPRSFSCLAALRHGPRPADSQAGRRAEDVVRTGSPFRSQDWQVMHLSRQTEQAQVWRVKAAPVWVRQAKGWSAETYLLIWASNDETGEEKYFLAVVGEEASLAVVVRVAFRRAVVEHCFRVCKSELGYGHFEGRNYRGMQRHYTLCLVAMGFVASHTERLRGEKYRVDDGASVPRVACGLPELDERPTWPERDAARRRMPCTGVA